ncbi:serine/threonine-protein kinase [Geodermatophilus bullaregiensis]|uniref:protein kinase domain-containing protein n=1 Tax=Geodermatophilus bullaregiensis TaxID=1564160 RepID=UPI0027DB9643|nr:protein kinase [Geodermatophilus bullaregiensis]MBM7808929.1 serine/threonine-protein kinase [Geodermatophilus bullaregiensis]
MTTVERGRQTLGGRYELQELIARGGMGQVWRGRDTLLDRSVAVKVLRSEYADDPTFLARFRAEARHAAALSHPNIAAVLDYGEGTAADTGEHLAYLVMELVDGAPLSTLLTEGGPLEPDAALSVLQQAAAGLAEAHRAGVVHRDVKPGNILVRPDGGVKLTDFGIAWSAESVPLTGTGQVIGTAQYMSPEQAAGERVGPASDVYALGLVGYESLTGRAAFTGTNPVTVALKQVREDPEPLPEDVPPDVRHLIGAALTKDPGQRPVDGDAFLHAIEDAVHPHPATSPRMAAVPATRPVAPAGQPPLRAAPPAVADRPAAEDGRRRRLLLALAVLAVVLLGGGAAALVGGLPDGDRPAAAAASEDGAVEDGIVLASDDYVGRPVEEVVPELTDLGLTVGQQTTVTPDVVPGTVTRLDPAGTEVDAGDRVRLFVAAAPPAVADDDPAPAPAGQAPSSAAEDAAPGTPEGTAPEPPASVPAPEPTTGGSAPAGDGGTVPDPTTDPTGEPAAEATPEPAPEVTPEPAPEVTPEPAPEVTPEPSAEPSTSATAEPSTGAPSEPAGDTEPSPSAGSEAESTAPSSTAPSSTPATGSGDAGAGNGGTPESPAAPGSAGAGDPSAAPGSAGATG